MTTPSSLAILVVGDTRRREFRAARAALEPFGRVCDCGDLREASTLIAQREFCPDLVVLAQAYPGQFRTQQVERLRRAVPLARMIALLGSWCEGEMRTGDPWPGGIRLYWHQWPGQVQRELEAMAEGRAGAWSLPMTATEEERLLAGDTAAEPAMSGLALVAARDRDMADWLSAACRKCGLATVWHQGQQPLRAAGVDVVIYDATSPTAYELREIADLRGSMPKAQLIALLDFPRIEDAVRARRAGADEVMSKPLMVADLWWTLLHRTDPSQGRVTSGLP